MSEKSAVGDNRNVIDDKNAVVGDKMVELVKMLRYTRKYR